MPGVWSGQNLCDTPGSYGCVTQKLGWMHSDGSVATWRWRPGNPAQEDENTCILLGKHTYPEHANEYGAMTISCNQTYHSICETQQGSMTAFAPPPPPEADLFLLDGPMTFSGEQECATLPSQPSVMPRGNELFTIELDVKITSTVGGNIVSWGAEPGSFDHTSENNNALLVHQTDSN